MLWQWICEWNCELCYSSIVILKIADFTDKEIIPQENEATPQT